MTTEIERLNKFINDQKTELDQWRFKYAEHSSLHHRLQEQLALLVLCFAEIETLRNRVKEKEAETEQVRRSTIALATQGPSREEASRKAYTTYVTSYNTKQY